MIKLPCGCTIKPFTTTHHIRMKSESLCVFNGQLPAIEHLEVCDGCYEDRYSKYPYLILTDEQGLLYLNSGNNTEERLND